MGFKGTKEEKALHYAENWEEITGLDYEDMSPIEVSEIDYLNGYNQALKDSKYTEMLEMLQRAKDKIYTVQSPSTSCRMLGDEIEQLIKEQVTEL